MVDLSVVPMMISVHPQGTYLLHNSLLRDLIGEIAIGTVYTVAEIGWLRRTGTGTF